MAKPYRILNVEPVGYSRQAYELLESLGRVDEQHVSRAELLAILPEYDVLIVRLAHRIDREVLDAGKRLAAVVTATTGLNHIDIAYAEKAGIKILSLRDEIAFLRSIPATAEHTWALLLSLKRHIPAATRHVLDGGWNRDMFKGRDLAGQKLGILGLGRIGQIVARYGLAFGMSVAAYDTDLAAWLEHVNRKDTMAGLLRECDILTIHVPLNSDTVRLIGAEELSQLPQGAVVINTSRGEIFDEDALVDALEQGHLAGAALDVVCYEQDPENRVKSRLLQYAHEHDNLLITPHIGGATYESMASTEIFMAKKLHNYLMAAEGQKA